MGKPETDSDVYASEKMINRGIATIGALTKQIALVVMKRHSILIQKLRKMPYLFTRVPMGQDATAEITNMMTTRGVASMPVMPAR